MLRNNTLFWKKATKEYSPGAHRHWGCINTHCSHFNTPFKQKFRSKHALNALFFEKSWANRLSLGGFTPNPPLASGGWGTRPPSCYSHSTYVIPFEHCSELSAS